MHWKISARSIEGTSHINSGSPCQDASKALRISTNRGQFIILIAADGCGSSKYSETGSSLIVSEVSSCLQFWIERSSNTLLLGDVLLHAFGHAHQMLQRLAKDRSTPIRDFASTCLCLVIGPSSFAAAQIGDGVIVRRNNGVTGCLFWQQQEYANVTHTLVDNDWNGKTQVFDAVLTPDYGDGWLIATDGIQVIACDSDKMTPHPGFVPVLFDKFCGVDLAAEGIIHDGLSKFLRSDRVNSAVTDDKTIVIACR